MKENFKNFEHGDFVKFNNGGRTYYGVVLSNPPSSKTFRVKYQTISEEVIYRKDQDYHRRDHLTILAKAKEKHNEKKI